MASVAGDEGGSNNISEVGDTLFGYHSQFLKLHCRTILFKHPPFYSHRKKTAIFSFNVRHPITKVLEKKQAPKIFLCELCQENNLTAFNSKEDSAQRLAVFYAKTLTSFRMRLRNTLFPLCFLVLRMCTLRNGKVPSTLIVFLSLKSVESTRRRALLLTTFQKRSNNLLSGRTSCCGFLLMRKPSFFRTSSLRRPFWWICFALVTMT
jgi:hypothetical protein